MMYAVKVPVEMSRMIAVVSVDAEPAEPGGRRIESSSIVEPL
jgi:hypothetical protein